jgi:type IX secretion system PorP/SprF family membrane protein
MKYIFRIILFLLLLIPFFNNKAESQDIHFSQFFEAPLLRNPALAGIFTGDMRLQTDYRNQWQSVTVPYQTCSMSGEFKEAVGRADDYLTLGGEIMYDKAGDISLQATHVLPALNFHKSLSSDHNLYLSLGFMGGWVQRSIDRSKITTDNQFDGTGYNPSLPTGETFNRTQYSYFDGNVGMSINSQVGEDNQNNMYFGIAYNHFNNPKRISFYSDPSEELMPKWVCSGGLKLKNSDYSYMTFEGDYSIQGPYTEFVGGMMITKVLDNYFEEPTHLFSAGLYMRWGDAIIPVVKLETRPLSFCFSYDINISQLSAASKGQGAYEMSISYQKFFEHASSSRDAVRCPKF